MLLKRALWTGACFVLMATAQAQDKTTDLDPVTVTATLNAEKSSKTGRNLYVIQGAELAKLPVHSIDDILRYLPGIEVQARGPMGAQSDIVIRGGTFQQVLVIVDGMRVNDPNTGHFSSYIPIVPAEIERIEVLKGASSAIYGSDAVGGVIHIITKTFAHTGTPGKSLNASVTGGAYGLLNANAAATYNSEKLAGSIGVQSNNADGQPQRGIDGFFHLHTFSASGSYKFSPYWRAAYRSSYDIRKFAAQNFYTTYLSDTASEKVSTSWNQASVLYQKGKDQFSLQGGYKTVLDHYAYNPSSIANDSRSKLWQALAQYEHTFNDAIGLVLGTQYQNKNIRSNDRGNHTSNQVAGFAVLNTHIGPHLSISPAVRLDYDQASGYELVPQVNASYRYHEFQLRGSAGKTIRNADFTERYNNYNKALVTSGRIGNPDLTAERSFSYEGGADYFGATNHLRVSATWFQRRQSDLIDWVNTPYADMPRQVNLAPGGSYALAENISKVVTSGVETDIQYVKPLTKTQSLSGTVGVIWLHSETNQGIASFYTSSHAKFMTNGMLRYTSDRLNVSVSGVYKVRDAQAVAKLGGQVSKEYFVANTKVEYFIVKNKVGVFAEADNVLNKTYADLLGAQMPGRWLMGGATIMLK